LEDSLRTAPIVAQITRRVEPKMSRPRKTAPSVHFSSFRTIFAIVVFPQPLSPTKPSVSPADGEIHAVHGLTISIVFLRRTPRVTRKCFRNLGLDQMLLSGRIG
jgi:hypothetical protein